MATFRQLESCRCASKNEFGCQQLIAQPTVSQRYDLEKEYDTILFGAIRTENHAGSCFLSVQRITPSEGWSG